MAQSARLPTEQSVSRMPVMRLGMSHATMNQCGRLAPPKLWTNLRSTRIVKEPGNKPGDDGGAAGGSNVRRKEVSPFKDCTESDMVDRSGSSGKAHHEAAAVQWET